MKSAMVCSHSWRPAHEWYMCDPWNYRRTSFSPGPEIALSDGRLWQFPAPPASPTLALDAFGPEYPALVHALAEPLETSERNQLELALAIILLNANYDLSPEQTRQLLLFHPSNPELTYFQAALHDLATDHRAAYLPAPSRTDEYPHTIARPAPWYRRLAHFFWKATRQVVSAP